MCLAEPHVAAWTQRHLTGSRLALDGTPYRFSLFLFAFQIAEAGYENGAFATSKVAQTGVSASIAQIVVYADNFFSDIQSVRLFVLEMKR